MKRKIFITGGSGMVASYVPLAFPHDTLIFSTRTMLDVTNKEAVETKIQQIKPDIIIHLAAATNLDMCEKDSKTADIVNHQATKYIATAAKDSKATLIYMSTCGVFDGKKKGYTEDDLPNPINIYGKTKLLGEKAVQAIYPASYIVRSGWIIGGGIKEKKFLSYMMKQLRTGTKELSAVSDTYGSITYAKELATFFSNILLKPYGIYHFASSGICSRFDIASFLVQTLKANVIVKPVSFQAFTHTFFAKRPMYEVAKSKKTKYDRTWQESLNEYITYELKKTLSKK